MVSLVNSHTNATRIGWHLREIELRFAPGSPPWWSKIFGGQDCGRAGIVKGRLYLWGAGEARARVWGAGETPETEKRERETETERQTDRQPQNAREREGERERYI